MLRLDINLVFTIINLLIWYAIIRIFLFKPINKVIYKRNAAIRKSMMRQKRCRKKRRRRKRNTQPARMK